MSADQHMRIAFVVMLLCILILLRVENPVGVTVAMFGFAISATVFISVK